MIEADERPDKTFVLGLQYHPEISVVRENDEASLVYFDKLCPCLPAFAFSIHQKVVGNGTFAIDNGDACMVN